MFEFSTTCCVVPNMFKAKVPESDDAMLRENRFVQVLRTPVVNVNVNVGDRIERGVYVAQVSL